MGAWGTGLFSDDTACDVRDNYVELLGDGLSGPEATERLLLDWSSSLEDPDEGPVFWLALASTQWRHGRLESQVLQQALSVIDDGKDLVRWKSSQDYRKRQVVLSKLRNQLVSPQPQPKRVRKRFRDTNEWEPGDLIAYRLISGRRVILRVIGHHVDKGGTSPVCELLDWVGDEIPEDPSSLAIRKGIANRPTTQFMIGRTGVRERPDERIEHLGVSLPPAQKKGMFTVFNWKRLDGGLKICFGLE